MTSTKTPVYRISGARKGLTEDVRGRQRRYVMSMSIRTVCFVLAIVLPSPWRWVALVGALLLPYIAVVIANAGREPTEDAPDSLSIPPIAPKALGMRDTEDAREGERESDGAPRTLRVEPVSSRVTRDGARD